MVDLICKSKGRLIVGGIGKSGIIGQKIVATLNSTGTRSTFLHPVEAMHGDLGMVGKNDIFIALSSSGETEELNALLPNIKRIGCKIIAFTGNFDSTLAQHSDIVINVRIDKEACPLGLAPTTSTTALLAMGDALAVTLINKKEFKPSDFKRFHPGGALGKRLTLKIYDIMLTGKMIPSVHDGTLMKDALTKIDEYNLGVTLVVSKKNILSGIITDGDIRRFVLKEESILGHAVEDIMTKNPLNIHHDNPVYDALNIMAKHQITVLPVTDASGNVKGILHLHDILGKGAFEFTGKPD
ncbi:MAG: KpsF/GutQ family sugar-phosphate isomerase [Deltaproteobacteria bacterium]|nr:KpsF/GutQ family sugar-phosphate isomerase [Deltaproteobacteria bacterium]